MHWSLISSTCVNNKIMFSSNQNVTGTWRGDFTDPVIGHSFTRDDFFNMSTNYGESYTILLNSDHPETSLVLHDPDFFFTTTNPATVPKYVKQGSNNSAFYYQIYIEVTEVQLLNLPNHPCDEFAPHRYTMVVAWTFVLQWDHVSRHPSWIET